MPYTEKDSLLSHEEQASDMGSRATSMKNFYDYDVEDEADMMGNEGEDEDDCDPKRHLINDMIAMVFGVAVLFSILFMFLPDGFSGEPTPKTIEQRVHR